jgi:hypothetical protein
VPHPLAGNCSRTLAMKQVISSTTFERNSAPNDSHSSANNPKPRHIHYYMSPEKKKLGSLGAEGLVDQIDKTAGSLEKKRHASFLTKTFRLIIARSYDERGLCVTLTLLDGYP